jgi:hypothetical protein
VLASPLHFTYPPGMRTVDDYLKAAWQALLAGDMVRRDELCRQAERLLRTQQCSDEVVRRMQEESILRNLPPPVICLPDRSDETVQ